MNFMRHRAEPGNADTIPSLCSQRSMPRVPQLCRRHANRTHLRFTHVRYLILSTVALSGTACGSATNTTSTTSIPRPSTTQSSVAHATGLPSPPTAGSKTVIYSFGIPLEVIDNDGTYVVGLDIPEGKYRSSGGAMCYWARLRSLNQSDIVDEKRTSDPQVVTIQASDTAFLTRNCGTWQMIPGF